MTTIQTYREASRRFLEQATQELDAGDLQQASEKGWGAACQMVKAVAAQRQWEHDSHRLLFKIVTDLQRETGEAGLRDLFHIASVLHQNFYEDWHDAEGVRKDLETVRRFVEKLEPLVGPDQALP